MTKDGQYTYTTNEIADRYGLSPLTVSNWRKLRGFPQNAALVRSGRVMWDVKLVDEWRRSQPGIQRRLQLAEIDAKIAWAEGV